MNPPPAFSSSLGLEREVDEYGGEGEPEDDDEQGVALLHLRPPRKPREGVLFHFCCLSFASRATSARVSS